MDREPRPSEEEPGIGLDESRQPDPDVEGGENPPARVIPGNVGSLDDVPDDILEERARTACDEETG
ncbi:MAG: hypothetical protein M3Q03_10830 [Chloroflexota bacterium]|nr:hypothetical protein [Chloroflexota bacterium]